MAYVNQNRNFVVQFPTVTLAFICERLLVSDNSDQGTFPNILSFHNQQTNKRF